MFALSVRSLDGESRRMILRPDTTLADIRHNLAESLPDFYDIKLFQGTSEELADDATLEVELQVVVTGSPSRALAEIEELTGEISQSIMTKDLDSRCDRLMGALSSLRRMGELAPAHSDELFSYASLFGYSTCYIFPCETTICRCVNALTTMVKAFAFLCADPSSCITQLTERYKANNYRIHNFVVALGLVELARRCGVDSLPNLLQTSLLDFGLVTLKGADFQSGIGCCFLRCVALEIIALLGNRIDHYDLVRKFAVKPYHGWFEQRVIKVLEMLCEKDDVSLGALNSGPELHPQEEPVNAREDNDISQEIGTAGIVAIARPESDAILIHQQVDPREDNDITQEIGIVGIDALAEPESDPILIHQQDLAESIMQSMPADGQAPICYQDTVAVYRQTHCCEQSLRVLTESDVLAPQRSRVEQAGCSLFPEVANGACLFVPLTQAQLIELDLQLDKYHILAMPSDKSAIDEALRSVNWECPPKLKEDLCVDPMTDNMQHAEQMHEESVMAPNVGADLNYHVYIFEGVDLLRPELRSSYRVGSLW